MFIQIKRIAVKKGFADEVIKKFSTSTTVERINGFAGLTIMKNVKESDTEEIMVELRWKTQDDYKNWKSSDEHKSSHANIKNEKPEFIIDVKVDLYNTIE